MLVVGSPGQNATTLWICKGVTKGNPLEVVLNGVVLVSFVEIYLQACPEVMQPWYANNLALL